MQPNNNGVHIHAQGLFNNGGTPGPLEQALASLITGATPFLQSLATALTPMLIALLTGLIPKATPPSAS